MKRWKGKRVFVADKCGRKGLVVLAAAAILGVINIVKRALPVLGVVRVYAVIGSIHISSMYEGISVAKILRKMGVKLVSPFHCIRTNAKIGIAKAMGERYLGNGSGRFVSIGRWKSPSENKVPNHSRGHRGKNRLHGPEEISQECIRITLYPINLLIT